MENLDFLNPLFSFVYRLFHAALCGHMEKPEETVKKLFPHDKKEKI